MGPDRRDRSTDGAMLLSRSRSCHRSHFAGRLLLHRLFRLRRLLLRRGQGIVGADDGQDHSGTERCEHACNEEFLHGGISVVATRRTIQHLRFSRQSGRLLRNERISPMHCVPCSCSCRRAVNPAHPRPRGEEGVKAATGNSCALCLGMVLIKAHTSSRIRFFVVWRGCRGKRDRRVERYKELRRAPQGTDTSRGGRRRPCGSRRRAGGRARADRRPRKVLDRAPAVADA